MCPGLPLCFISPLLLLLLLLLLWLLLLSVTNTLCRPQDVLTRQAAFTWRTGTGAACITGVWAASYWREAATSPVLPAQRYRRPTTPHNNRVSYTRTGVGRGKVNHGICVCACVRVRVWGVGRGYT